jgi:hypothetical protein
MTSPRTALFVASALFWGCATPAEGARGEASTESLELVCEEPMPLREFVKWAQQRTGRIFVLPAKPARDVEISWIGTLRCRKDDLLSFVQTMLYVKGYALQPRQQGDLEVLEVVSLRAG